MSIYILKGLSPWVMQRISSVLIALFVVYASICIYTATGFTHEAWLVRLLAPYNTIIFGLFTLALLLHAWVGVRDVVLDYIHHFMLRIFFLTVIASMLIGCGIWVAKILLLTTVGIS